MSNIRRRAVISGIVQGVAFRYYTRDVARATGVTGWVRNLPDGRVEAVFEGDADKVTAMINWCRKGPPSSRVDTVEVFEEPHRGEFPDFDIAFTGRWI